jgi:hypothetical protein
LDIGDNCVHALGGDVAGGLFELEVGEARVDGGEEFAVGDSTAKLFGKIVDALPGRDRFGDCGGFGGPGGGGSGGLGGRRHGVFREMLLHVGDHVIYIGAGDGVRMRFDAEFWKSFIDNSNQLVVGDSEFFG